MSTSFVTDAGTEVRPLYQCGIVCPLDADPSVTLGEIVEAMAGQCGWIGGRLTLSCGRLPRTGGRDHGGLDLRQVGDRAGGTGADLRPWSTS